VVQAGATALSREDERRRVLAAFPVSRETAARLDRFVLLLEKWQRTTNLVGPSTLGRIWTRHIADSLQLAPLMPEARTWIDLGSGAGFPGLVIACALSEYPDAKVHLIESTGKKAAFLREAARETGAPVVVHARRIEDVAAELTGRFDVVTARALAPMTALLGYAQPFLERGAKGLFLKGQDVDRELTEAAKYWNIEAEVLPSRTDAGGRIVRVEHVWRR
jgi:16S rRNA (guanine527-N7)-methyltransferase